MDCSKITANIFLGNIYTPINVEYLAQNNIKFIINAANMHYKKIGGITYLDLPLDDASNINISIFFPLTKQFIDTAISSNNNVLVHCQMGISRSSTIVIAYLISNGMLLKNAFDYVKKRREIISPNSGFLRQLIDYEKKIHKLNRSSMDMINLLNDNKMKFDMIKYKTCKYCLAGNLPNQKICSRCKSILN